MEAGSQGRASARCSCGQAAVTFIRYSGSHLCASCFRDYVESRVRRELAAQAPLKGGGRVALALSGGKDSLVALRLLAKVLGKRRDVELLAITVDEGIAGYRPPQVASGQAVCRDLGVEHRVVALKAQALVSVDEIAARELPKAPCSYCGVLRRRAVNAEARAWGADYLATGHNLDDLAQTILMSFVRGDLNKLARLAPHTDVKAGLVRRILPLRWVPEKEVFLYALLEGLPIAGQQCPHMGRAARGPIKGMLMALEEATPGTRHAILRTHERLRGALERLVDESAPSLGVCPRCREPSVSDLCQACALVEEAGLGASGPTRAL